MVLEDVVFDNNKATPGIIKHHILKHYIPELRISITIIIIIIVMVSSNSSSSSSTSIMLCCN